MGILENVKAIKYNINTTLHKPQLGTKAQAYNQQTKPEYTISEQPVECSNIKTKPPTN